MLGEQIAVFKDYSKIITIMRRNTRRNPRTRLMQSRNRLETSKRAFSQSYTSRDRAVKTSFVISHNITKTNKPFTDLEFNKEYLVVL